MKTCTVVVPTIWKGQFFTEMLPKLSNSEAVEQIIIIDNKPSSETPSVEYPKVLHIKNSDNLYVNPSWNLGVELATSNNIMLLSDDVKFDVTYIPNVLESLERGTVIGAHPDAWKDNSRFELKFLYDHVHSWATLFFVRKEDWIPIPDELKIWYGDNWVCNHAQLILGYSGIGIETINCSSSGLPEFNTVIQNDIRLWQDGLHTRRIQKQFMKIIRGNYEQN